MRRHRALLQPLKLRSIARRDRAVGASEDEHPGSRGRTEGPYRRAVEVLYRQLAGWRVRAHHQRCGEQGDERCRNHLCTPEPAAGLHVPDYSCEIRRSAGGRWRRDEPGAFANDDEAIGGDVLDAVVAAVGPGDVDSIHGGCRSEAEVQSASRRASSSSTG